MIEAHVSGRTNLAKQPWILWPLMFIDRTQSPTDTLA